MRQRGATPGAAATAAAGWLLPRLVLGSSDLEGSEAFLRPGAEPWRLQPEELEREESQRYQTCDMKVLDAESADFLTSWRSLAHEPLLITNMVKDWPALSEWTPKWFREVAAPALRTPIRPWNMSDPRDPQCMKGDCAWADKWGMPPERQPVTEYFDRWNVRQGSTPPAAGAAMSQKETLVKLREPNAMIFDPSQKCHGNPLLERAAPQPEAFRNMCNNRHVAFAAKGISHGFHRHQAAWQAQVVGFKSWYLLPEGLYVRPRNLTTQASPFGFPHDAEAKRANGLCGYRPVDPEVQRLLHFCVQGPGETMYVPDDWWHGTCSLDDFTVGTGGGLREQSSGRVELTLHNDLPEAVDVYFLREGKEEMPSGKVPPQGRVVMTTYSTHVFRFRVARSGEFLDEYAVPDGSSGLLQHRLGPSSRATAREAVGGGREEV